jgi:hypothetical protein
MGRVAVAASAGPDEASICLMRRGRVTKFLEKPPKRHLWNAPNEASTRRPGRSCEHEWRDHVYSTLHFASLTLLHLISHVFLTVFSACYTLATYVRLIAYDEYVTSDAAAVCLKGPPCCTERKRKQQSTTGRAKQTHRVSHQTGAAAP